MVLGNICELVCFLVGSNRSQVFLFIVPYSFFKKLFSKILQNSIVYEIHRKTPTLQSLFHKFATLLKKETLIQMFSCEVCNFFFRPVLLQKTNCYDYNFNYRHKWFCIHYIDLPHRISNFLRISLDREQFCGLLYLYVKRCFYNHIFYYFYEPIITYRFLQRVSSYKIKYSISF